LYIFCHLTILCSSFTERPGLEGASRIMNLQPPPTPSRQGHQAPYLILDQATHGPTQPGLEHPQGQGIHNLSGQPVPAPHHSHSKELHPDIQPKPSLLLLKTISPCHAVSYPFKELKELCSLIKINTDRAQLNVNGSK